MICAKETGRGYVEEQTHRGARDRGDGWPTPSVPKIDEGAPSFRALAKGWAADGQRRDSVLKRCRSEAPALAKNARMGHPQS
jgi:hypothetical protein